jgi:hypothetical protein
MKRAILAIFSAAFLASAVGAKADPAADQQMASRYLQAAQSGDVDSYLKEVPSGLRKGFGF